jgi:AraC family transcriptional activator of mtrCDE
MRNCPISRTSVLDIDRLMANIEVSSVKLSECRIGPGWPLVLAGTGATGIHYGLSGTGRLIVGDDEPIDLSPGTLVITPPRTPVRIDGQDGRETVETLKVVEARRGAGDALGQMRRFAAGHGQPAVISICGSFRAVYGASIDFLTMLPLPIVEHFESPDDLDRVLRTALAEIRARQLGMSAMTTALLKQALVMVLRRSMAAPNSWLRHGSISCDPSVAKAFADMVARPRAPHRVQTLAGTAGLSRSTFMARFKCAFGRSPMATLRELRMSRAATLLAGSNRLIDQVARDVGYASRSSFQRAFQKAHGVDPSHYRGAASRPAAD